MSIITAVNRSLGKAVRATHAETGSPYFADAALKHHLRRLEYRLAQVDQTRPELLVVLADHLGTPATLPAVTTEVRARAANLLTRRQEMDTARGRYPVPRTPRRIRGHARSFPR